MPLDVTIKSKAIIAWVHPVGIQARFPYDGCLLDVFPDEDQSFLLQAEAASANFMSVEAGRAADVQANSGLDMPLNPPQFNTAAIIEKIEECIDSQAEDKIGVGPRYCY